jgi:Uma2 family endonuclease
MGRLKSSSPPVAGHSVVLDAIDWQMYSRLLRVFAERPRIRLTYDCGRLEIMSPHLEHDFDARLLGQLVWVMAEVLRLPLMPGGSATMRRKLKRKGIEGDEIFWIANAERMKGRRRLNLRRDPPPDLAIEVDLTRSCLDRMAIYAAFKIPEVWRLEGDVLEFHVLGSKGKYQQAQESRSFPGITPADLMRFLQDARGQGDRIPMLRKFRRWLRKFKR